MSLTTIGLLLLFFGSFIAKMLFTDNSGKKDYLLGAGVSLIGLGLGHFYAEDKRQGFIIMIVQLIILTLVGVTLIFKPGISPYFYLLYVLIALWSVYDVIKTIKLINKHIN